MAWAQGQSGRVSLRHPYAHAYAVLTRIFASSPKIWDFLVGSLLSTCFTLSGLCHFPTTCHNMTCAGPTPGTSRQVFFSPSDLHTPGNQNGLSCSHVFKLQSGAFHLPQVDIFTRAMFPKPALSLQLFPFWVLQRGCFFFSMLHSKKLAHLVVLVYQREPMQKQRWTQNNQQIHYDTFKGTLFISCDRHTPNSIIYLTLHPMLQRNQHQRNPQIWSHLHLLTPALTQHDTTKSPYAALRRSGFCLRRISL